MPTSSAAFLLIRARSRIVGLRLEDTVETMRPLPVGPVPGAPVFIRGLSVIRGTPVPVVDLGMLLGDGEAERTRRFVTIRVEGRTVALAVEDVLGFRELDAAALKELPPLLRDAGAEPVAAIGALDRQLLVVLAAARILPGSVWQAVTAHGGAS